MKFKGSIKLNKVKNWPNQEGAGPTVTMMSFLFSVIRSVFGGFVLFQACYLMGMLRVHFSDVFPSILNRNTVDTSNLPFLITSLSGNHGSEFYLVGVGAIIVGPLIFVGFISYMFYSFYTYKPEETRLKGRPVQKR